MRQAEVRRSTGIRDPSSFNSEPTWGALAGCTIAWAWKLMVAGGIGATSDSSPPPAHRDRHRDPPAGRDVPGLPAVGGDGHIQPPADALVDHAAGAGLPGRGDIAEDGERRLAKRVPDLLAGQPRRHRSGVVPSGWVRYLLACRAKACLLVLVGGCHGRAS